MQVMPYSGIREIFDLASTMDDVVHFEIGEPDFTTHTTIMESAFERARQGMTHYTSSAGFEPLRRKIAEKLNTQHGMDYVPEEIVITCGGMEALMLSMLVTIDPGDEVLLPTPHWPNYPAHVLLAGGTAKEYRLKMGNGFVPDIEELRSVTSPETKGVILNYPHNPSGAVLKNDDVKRICGYVRDRDLLLYSDEAYESIVFDNRRFESILAVEGMKQRSIIIRTFSKSHAMTGWRIGYVASPRRIADRIARLHEHTTACASSVSQMAALAALESNCAICSRMVREYERRRDLLVRELSSIPGIKIFKPEGTIYAFVDISSFGLCSLSVARMLLETSHVAVAPGTAFGAAGEGFIRICFANSMENIAEGTQRMRVFFKMIGKTKTGTDRGIVQNP
jgi:aminotransferase